MVCIPPIGSHVKLNTGSMRKLQIDFTDIRSHYRWKIMPDSWSARKIALEITWRYTISRKGSYAPTPNNMMIVSEEGVELRPSCHWLDPFCRFQHLATTLFFACCGFHRSCLRAIFTDQATTMWVDMHAISLSKSWQWFRFHRGNNADFSIFDSMTGRVKVFLKGTYLINIYDQENNLRIRNYRYVAQRQENIWLNEGFFLSGPSVWRHYES